MSKADCKNTIFFYLGWRLPLVKKGGKKTIHSPPQCKTKLVCTAANSANSHPEWFTLLQYKYRHANSNKMSYFFYLGYG